jgi:malonate-semialdehyde dehydrogenase (acetylating) / methylmalonate-semialdehyde dehydrogenase
MIPLWITVSISIAAGNTLIIKPSERDSGTTMIIVKLSERAGLPPGVLSVMHGSKDLWVTFSDLSKRCPTNSASLLGK